MSRASRGQCANSSRIRASNRRRSIRACLVLLVGSTLSAAAFAEPSLVFERADTRSKSLSLSAMRSACPAQTVVVEDPYHDRTKRYFAMPFECVLDLGFADVGGADGLRTKGLILEALDGYTRPAAGADLLIPGGYLAYGEADLMQGPETAPRFAPIDRRKIDPGPFYLIWTGADQNDPHTQPWPYQLARIEIADFAEAFPRTVPTGLAASDPGWAGYALFQQSCASCHAINGQGGKVGPELNVPKSIVEYRPIDQIKAYIRDPQATRYTTMPAHPNLSDADLDRLIAYFRAMSTRKRDPRAESLETKVGS